MPEAGIDLGEIEYVEAVWFVDGTVDGNWMTWLYRAKGETQWTLKYRFRYYRDNKVHGSADESSWYQGTMPAENLKKMVDTTDVIARMNVARFAGTLDKTVVQGPPERAIDLLTGKPWWNMKVQAINPYNRWRKRMTVNRKVVEVPVGAPARIVDAAAETLTLEHLKSHLPGVEHVGMSALGRLPTGAKVDMWYDDDGLLNQAKPNRALPDGTVICGPLMFCTREGDESFALHAEDAETILEAVQQWQHLPADHTKPKPVWNEIPLEQHLAPPAPAGWMYLSFVKDDAFQGAAVIRGGDMLSAVRRACVLNINPGGQVLGFGLSEEALAGIPNEMRERLLTWAEMEAAGWAPTKAGDIKDGRGPTETA